MRFIIAILATFLIISCRTNQEFDKSKWNEKDLDVYRYRNSMLKDLLTNHKLKGLSFKQLTSLIGDPENYSGTEANTIYYNIVTDYGLDIDPVYLKHLVFKLNNDSVVVKYEIKEVKH